MKVRVRCPNGHALSVDEDLKGKRVRCPKCKELFRAEPIVEKTAKSPVAATKKKRSDDDEDEKPKRRPVRASSDDEDEDEGDESPQSPEERRKTRQRDKKKRLAQVNTGLLVYIVKLWVLVVLVLFAFITRIFGVMVDITRMPSFSGEAKDLSREAIEAFGTFTSVGVVFVLVLTVVMPIVGVVAAGFCCLLPKKSEARGTAIAAVVSDALLLIAAIIIPLVYYDVLGLERDSKQRLFDILCYAGVVLAVAALLLYCIFLRQLTKYLQKLTLSGEALNRASWLLIMSLTAPLLYMAIEYLSKLVVFSAGSAVSLAVQFLITIIWFALFYYMYFQGMLRLVNAVRKELDEVT